LFLGVSILIKFLQIVGVQLGVQTHASKFGHRISRLLLVIQGVVQFKLTDFDMFLGFFVTHYPRTISMSIKQPQKNVENGKESKHLQRKFLCKKTKIGG
jgi:hypothetical protein